jgi:hypothetical protein
MTDALLWGMEDTMKALPVGTLVEFDLTDPDDIEWHGGDTAQAHVIGTAGNGKLANLKPLDPGVSECIRPWGSLRVAPENIYPHETCPDCGDQEALCWDCEQEERDHE